MRKRAVVALTATDKMESISQSFSKETETESCNDIEWARQLLQKKYEEQKEERKLLEARNTGYEETDYVAKMIDQNALRLGYNSNSESDSRNDYELEPAKKLFFSYIISIKSNDM